MKAKRIIGLLTVAAMLLTMTPLTVFAVSGTADAAMTDSQVAELQTGSDSSSYSFITEDEILSDWSKGPAHCKTTGFYFGTEGTIWRACRVEDNSLILMCDPSCAYGVSTYGNGIAGHVYEQSELDSAIKALYEDNKHFTSAEIALMKDVAVTYHCQNNMFDKLQTVTTKEKRKMYAPGVSNIRGTKTNLKYDTDAIEVGGNNSYITISLLPLQSSDSIWLRDISYDNDFKAYSVEGSTKSVVQSLDDGSATKKVVPVFQLKLNDDTNNVLFASLAQPAKENADFNEAMTVRYDGSSKIKYSAGWNSSKVYLSNVQKGQSEYLYVQWEAAGKTYVKSVALTELPEQEYEISAEAIGGSGFSIPADAKVWIEKKDTAENITYAVMAKKEKEEGPVAPANLVGGRTSKNGKADASITGLEKNQIYEYKLHDSDKWKSVPAGSTSIDNLTGGYYDVRIAETEKYKASKAVTCKVYDRYDITIDKEKAKALINSKDATAYYTKMMFDLAWLYTGKTVTGTTMKTLGNSVVELISGKFNAKSGDPVYAKVNALKKQMDELQKQVSELNLSIDKQTKEILGAVSTAQMESMLNSVSKQADSIETKYYNTQAFKDAITAMGSFYDGEMAMKEGTEEATDTTKDIDEAMHYFFSSDYDKVLDVSPMTGTDYLTTETKGRDFLNDMLTLGSEFLANHALNVDKTQKNIFSLYEGVCSYNYNFNAQTFELRKTFNENAYNYYEKGYAVLATAITYEMTNHQNTLDEIEALEAAKASASSEEAAIIQKSLDEICTRTTSLYEKKSNMTLSDVKRLHTKAIAADKQDLENLTDQYEHVVAAKNKADKSLSDEEDLYTSDGAVMCYRNGKCYNRTLKYIYANQDYINSGLENTESGKNIDTYFKTTNKEGHALYDGFNMSKGTYKFYAADDLNDKFKNLYDSGFEGTEFGLAVGTDEILDLVRYSNNRNTTLDKELAQVFTCIDESGESVDYNTASQSALGIYCNGVNSSEVTGGDGLESYVVDRIENHDATMEFKNHRISLNHNVKYKSLDDSSTDAASIKSTKTRSVQWRKSAPAAYKTQPTEYKSTSDKVLVLSTWVDGKGRGGDLDPFMATGTAKKSTNKITWEAVEGADGYDVYYAKAGKTMKKVKSTTARKYIKKGLNRKAISKYYVKAYEKTGSMKWYIAKTPVIYVAGANAGYSNATKVTVKPVKLKLKEGKTANIKAKIVKKSNNKTVIWKHYVKSKLRYLSTDGTVTVSSKGKVKAITEGSAYIYIYTANGAFAKVKVTVEAGSESE